MILIPSVCKETKDSSSDIDIKKMALPELWWKNEKHGIIIV